MLSSPRSSIILDAQITSYQQWLIDRRIACPEAGYPVSEARYKDVYEFIESLTEEERERST